MLTCALQNIKEGLEGRPASWYSDVFNLIFPNIDREKANKTNYAPEEKSETTSKSESSSEKDD